MLEINRLDQFLITTPLKVVRARKHPVLLRGNAGVSFLGHPPKHESSLPGSDGRYHTVVLYPDSVVLLSDDTGQRAISLVRPEVSGEDRARAEQPFSQS